MTEEEAKDKWCSLFQLDTQITFSGNRVQQVNRGNCIGSACMAWRWTKKPGPLEVGVHTAAESPGDGYCGLVGKP